ncbi:MAG TPA: MBL fold metallo-hydrolase [Gemmatimonadaceae bacterium]|jgi:L-ascorbate metabolism protein UlaG (beta-lactamase superfamily)|nr:MBL fold metallo-hydrolase [Gemmatimonadaceae bacterium]
MTLHKLVAIAAASMLAGCATLAAPAYHGPPSDHFDGKRFHNYVRARDAQIDDALRSTVRRILHKNGSWPDWEEIVPDVPPRRVGGSALRVTFVNHATVLIQTDSMNILTDPVWSNRVSPVQWFGPKRHRPPGIRFEDLPPIDVVLLSHNHYDHLDLPTLKRLVAAHHPRIIAGLGNAAFLARHGIPGAQDIDWWQTTSIGPALRVSGVPAQHWSARALNDKWRTLWLGFVITGSGGPVYFAGDTGFGEFLATIRDRFAPFRFAILPIGPMRPVSAMKPRHMSAGDAVHAYELLGVSSAMAMHFGTFRQGADSDQEPLDSLRAAIDAAGSCARGFWALRNGESWRVPALESSAAISGCARSSAATGVAGEPRSRRVSPSGRP